MLIFCRSKEFSGLDPSSEEAIAAQAVCDECARLVSDGSYKPDTSMGPSGTSAIIQVAAWGEEDLPPISCVEVVNYWIPSIQQSTNHHTGVTLTVVVAL